MISCKYHGEWNPVRETACPRCFEELRAQVRTMQEVLERKNKELDALHYVWCNGGCDTGVHRWTGGPLTEEIVALAERNTARLRTWLKNNRYKAARSAVPTDDKPSE